MRKIILRVAEWVHATLIMAMILPLLYTFGAKPPDTVGGTLYYKCLLIALPVVTTDFAVKKCKGLLSYLFISALVFAATFAIGWSVAGTLHQSPVFWVYMVMLLAETVFVIVSRIADRLRRRREDDTWDGTEPLPGPSFDDLKAPSFWFLIYFVIAYALAVNLNSSAVCNAALFSAVVYTLVTLLYEHVCRTEEYLSLNQRTCNIPSRRIYGIGNGMMAIFLLLFAVVVLSAIFTIPKRQYRDVREYFVPIDAERAEEEMEIGERDDVFTGLPPEFYGEPKPVPEWVIRLINILAAVLLLALAAVLVKSIHNMFHAFRKAADENGDIVEELREADEGVRIKKIRKSRDRLSERERIRKDYKRFIRKHRKERPAQYESPTEIERNAGIPESEEGIKLHEQYELARYGRETKGD